MTHWFFIALVGPVLWALVNHIDKYMLHKYFRSSGVYTLMIFSCISSVLVMPVAFFVNKNIFLVDIYNILFLFLLGLLSAVAFFYYLKAVELEEISIVIPLFQLLPVFSYFLAYFILGESLSIPQVLSAFIIMLGAFMLSLEIDIDHSIIFKKRALALVALSSICFAFNDVLFKKIALQESFWASVFWQYAGLFVFGIFVIIFSKKGRKSFYEIIHHKDYKIFSLNILSEILYMTGNLASAFATLLAPVVLVLIVGSYQPLFVFIGAVIMTMLLPKIVTERVSKGHVIHRILCIIIIAIGSYFLYTSSY